MNNTVQQTKDLLLKLNEVSSESIQTMLTKAYEDGFRDGVNHAMNPVKLGEIELEKLNLNLPSGTIWCCLKDKYTGMTIKQMLECGLKLPTALQLAELHKCPLSYNDSIHDFCLLGCNGQTTRLLTNSNRPTVIVADSYRVDDNYKIWTYSPRRGDNGAYWQSKSLFIGENVRPLFVL